MSETTSEPVQRYDCDDPYTLHESINGSLVDYFEYERVVAERDDLRIAHAAEMDRVSGLLAEAYAERDAAVRERGELEYVLKNTTGMLQATSAENDTLGARLAAAEAERDAAVESLTDSRATAYGLRARLAACEVELHNVKVAVREWWDHDSADKLYAEVFGGMALDEVDASLRAAVAAETQGVTDA